MDRDERLFALIVALTINCGRDHTTHSIVKTAEEINTEYENKVATYRTEELA